MNSLEMERIYATYSGKVMGYLRARIQTKAAVGTWIFSITRNTLIDHYRKKRPTEELDENLKDDTELDESLLTNETLSELAAALLRLPEQLRDIVVLRYYDGKPLTEIAEMMGLSYGAVKLRHQNALMLLRERMA